MNCLVQKCVYLYVKEPSTPGVKTGRPREFCEEKAIEAAMRVFWAKGYEGASLSDLTEAMGINRPTLYATFGDKESLFRRAIERYAEGPAAYVREALHKPNVRDVVEALLRGELELLSDPASPRGCFLVQGVLACGSNAEPLKQVMIEWRKHGEADIQKRLEQAQAEGDLSSDIDSKDLARYLNTVLAGLAIQAANGATKEEMTRVVEMNLRSLRSLIDF